MNPTIGSSIIRYIIRKDKKLLIRTIRFQRLIESNMISMGMYVAMVANSPVYIDYGRGSYGYGKKLELGYD